MAHVRLPQMTSMPKKEKEKIKERDGNNCVSVLATSKLISKGEGKIPTY
jgi:hypothetical protein